MPDYDNPEVTDEQLLTTFRNTQFLHRGVKDASSLDTYQAQVDAPSADGPEPS